MPPHRAWVAVRGDESIEGEGEELLAGELALLLPLPPALPAPAEGGQASWVQDWGEISN